MKKIKLIISILLSSLLTTGIVLSATLPYASNGQTLTKTVWDNVISQVNENTLTLSGVVNNGTSFNLENNPCTVVTNTKTLPTNTYASLSVSCPSGTYVTGGGCESNDASDGSSLINVNTVSGNGWKCNVKDTDSNDEIVTISAICCF